MEYLTADSLLDMFYYSGALIPEDGTFKISPSQISLFFDNPVTWCKRNLLGEELDITNEGTVLGTLLHKIYECRLKGYKLSKTALEEALVNYVEREDLGDKVNISSILSLYPIMSSITIDSYLNEVLTKPTNINVESSLCCHLGNGIYLGGTCDLHYGDTVADYKNLSTKPTNLDTIPFPYRIQLLAYAYMLNSLNVCNDIIKYMELSYTIRPTKTLPPRNFVVRQYITEQDKKLLTDTLTIIKDSVLHVLDKPEDTYKIFKSMQFKELYDEGKLIFNV